MKPVAITVNGRRTEALVEPRTHLGDFLREQCRLTGTHLGCEHGVCGACTVLVDGVPVRSCITYAVACDGLEVRTVEGFDDDPVMEELREAFSREHGLQCGFCTPGMLIASRDIVLRLPEADEHRIRVELSGNLCRCTGYLGIVNAVKSVINARRSAGAAATQPGPAAAVSAAKPAFATFTPAAPSPAAASQAGSAAPDEEGARKGWTRFEESFEIGRAPPVVWAAFKDLPMVASCLPGAELTEHDDTNVKGRMSVRLGPIVAAFAGSASIERDDQALRGIIRGAGSDRGTGSRTRGEVRYWLEPVGTERTRVGVVVEYNLQGTLAQFSRSNIAQELGRRLVGEFAANLNQRMGAPADTAARGPEPRPLNAGSFLWGWLVEKVRSFFSRR